MHIYDSSRCSVGFSFFQLLNIQNVHYASEPKISGKPFWELLLLLLILIMYAAFIFFSPLQTQMSID